MTSAQKYRPEDFPGYFATVMWVGIGVWLFWITPEASFFTWQAVVYFLVGTFAAGLVFGVLGLTLQRLIPVLKPSSEAAKKSDGMAQTIGTLVGAAQFILVYFIAKSIIIGLLFPAAGSG